MRKIIVTGLLLALPLAAWAFPAFETITVSTTAVGLSAATLGGGTTGVPERTACIFTLASNDVRWRVDGLNPTAAVGHAFAAAGTLNITGNDNLRAIRFIRSGGADGVLSVTCWP